MGLIISLAKSVVSNLSIYTLIPLVTKIILSFAAPNLSFATELITRLLVGIISFMFANILQTVREESCNEQNTNVVNFLIKTAYDAIIQYGGAYIIPKVLKFIPILGMILRVLTMLPIIGNLMDILLWIVGFGIAFWFTNVSEGKSDKVCSGSISAFKKKVGNISLVIVVIFEFLNSIF